MKQKTLVVLGLALVSVGAWGQENRRWTIVETRAGKEPQAVLYQRTLTEAPGEVLVCQKGQRTQTTVVDASGATLRWTKQNGVGTKVELIRDGPDIVATSAEGTTRIPAGGAPWVQDLNQLGIFVLGRESQTRFVAFADFLDARLQASDMTLFKATKVKVEPQAWSTGTGPCWRVRVTFDDLRSAFWGADYWYRVSDGQLVRYEEVRGGPGTPVTVGTLASEASE